MVQKGLNRMGGHLQRNAVILVQDHPGPLLFTNLHCGLTGNRNPLKDRDAVIRTNLANPADPSRTGREGHRWGMKKSLIKGMEREVIGVADPIQVVVHPGDGFPRPAADDIDHPFQFISDSIPGLADSCRSEATL